MDQSVLSTLLLYNPWLETPNTWPEAIGKFLPQAQGFPYVQRFAANRPSWPRNGKINLVIGPRQSGKSTLIWHILSDMGPEGVVYINANESIFQEWCLSPAGVWRDLQTVAKRPKILFFEEVQYIENAALFLKGLIDLGIGAMVFATGSASYHLHDKIRESLAGRAERLLLLPFSLGEWAAQDAPPAQLIRSQQVFKKLDRILINGSYPEVCFAEKPENILNRLVESFVIRDASDVFRIRYPAKFRQLLALMATQIGNLVNFSDWASQCGLDVKTVESYAAILGESHVIKLVTPYVGGKRAEIISAPKMFFIDNGIRNAVIHQFSDFQLRPDKGVLFENWLFSELYKHVGLADSLHFWRSKAGAEVDFVWRCGATISAFEAKAAFMERPSLSRSARSFISAYSPAHLFIVNLKLDARMEVDGTLVQWITPVSLVEHLSRLGTGCFVG